MRFVVDSFTDAGPRTENQDTISFRAFGANNLAIAIADGLGGHAGGKRASELAANTFVELASENDCDLRAIAHQIHSQIITKQRDDRQNRSMATTLSAAVFKSGLMEFVHCGDTRISVARNKGIKRLTVDHTEAQRLFSAGAITKAEMENYPRKNILESALGAKEEPKIETGSFSTTLGDKFFFSTDGFHNKIPLRELFRLATPFKLPSDIVKKMQNEMKNRNADDNYSLATVSVLP